MRGAVESASASGETEVVEGVWCYRSCVIERESELRRMRAGPFLLLCSALTMFLLSWLVFGDSAQKGRKEGRKDTHEFSMLCLLIARLNHRDDTAMAYHIIRSV